MSTHMVYQAIHLLLFPPQRLTLLSNKSITDCTLLCICKSRWRFIFDNVPLDPLVVFQHILSMVGTVQSNALTFFLPKIILYATVIHVTSSFILIIKHYLLINILLLLYHIYTHMPKRIFHSLAISGLIKTEYHARKTACCLISISLRTQLLQQVLRFVELLKV